jgi:hypothetical protein
VLVLHKKYPHFQGYPSYVLVVHLKYIRNTNTHSKKFTVLFICLVNFTHPESPYPTTQLESHRQPDHFMERKNAQLHKNEYDSMKLEDELAPHRNILDKGYKVQRENYKKENLFSARDEKLSS